MVKSEGKQKQQIYDLLILGGGASGMMAALVAAMEARKKNLSASDFKILLIERHSILGRKLLATGNGTCNLTNMRAGPEHAASHYYCDDMEALIRLVSYFTPDDCIELFRGLGIEIVVAEEGKVYPLSFQASSVRNALEEKLSNLGVTILKSVQAVEASLDEERTLFRLDIRESEVKPFKDRTGNIRDFTGEADLDLRKLLLSQGHVYGKKLILAAGGKASPNLSSDGLGYQLAASFGHSCSRIYPGIVRLLTDKLPNNNASGTRLVARLKLYKSGDLNSKDKSGLARQGEEVFSYTDEILFTDHGVSGPGPLQVSGHIKPREAYSLSIDFLPQYSSDFIAKILEDRVINLDYRYLEDFLEGLLPSKLGKALLIKNFPHRLKEFSSSLNREDLQLLLRDIKDLELRVLASDDWEQAQVTVGGIRLGEINMDTMESRLQPGLYITGELLDIRGDCGGFNLHQAWATGHLAATSINKYG